MFIYVYDTPLAYLVVLASLVCSAIATVRRSFYEVCCMRPYALSKGRQLFTMFSSVLIHGERGHMFISILLLAFGLPEVEYMLVDDFGSIYGHFIFLFGLVFTAIVVGALSTLQFRHNDLHWSSGGSALFYAMMMLYLLYLPVDPLTGLPPFLRAFLPIFYAALLLVILIVLALLKDPAGSVHIYGALAGILLACFFRPAAINEAVHLLSPETHLEKCDQEAPRNDQPSNNTHDDAVKQRVFTALSTSDGVRFVCVQAIHPVGDG